jgi:nicotinate-nucleotide pyrophosphorylase (carboxylating)
MVLIKENHVRASGGIGAALRAAREGAVDEPIEIEIEVTNEVELGEALAGGAGRILLDNMTLDQLSRAVRRVRSTPPPWPVLEASGGVTLANVREIAGTGVDLVSVGAITHSAPWLDLSLLVLE